MNIVSIIFLIIIFLSGLGSRSAGLINRRASFEAGILTLLTLPVVATILTNFLAAYAPPAVAGLGGFLIAFLIVFIIFKQILEKITGLAKEPGDFMDKTGALFVGFLKGFLISSFIVIIYGGLMVDRLVPENSIITGTVKRSFVNAIIKNKVEYYRKMTFGFYNWASDTQVSDVWGTDRKKAKYKISWLSSPEPSKKEKVKK